MFKKKNSNLITEEALSETTAASENPEERIPDEEEIREAEAEMDTMADEDETIVIPKPKRKIGSDRRALGIFLMIVAIICIVFVNPAMTFIQEREYVKVYVATQDIEKGFTITNDMVEEISTPQSAALKAFTSTENPVGKIAQSRISKDDIITKSIIGDTMPFEHEYLYTIPANKQVMSVTVNSPAETVSGYIQGGDVVRIYTNDPNGDNKPKELEYVRVLDITKVDNDPEGNISTVILLVDEIQAGMLVKLEKAGSLHLALVNRFDEQESKRLLEAQDRYLNHLRASNSTADTESNE